jgi:predicted transglutaminase-like cysteine proteinase
MNGIRDLEEVNSRYNEVPYSADPAFLDTWAELDPAAKEGNDCDSYAVSKLLDLCRRGWPIERLRLATCITEGGTVENHGVLVAVLVVENESQEYVLDNRQNGLCSLSDLDAVGYTPVRIQREGGSKSWKEWKWEK